MVKSIISSLIVILVITVGVVFETLSVQNTFKDFDKSVTYLYKQVEEETATEEDALKVQQEWIKKKRFLHVFLPHSELKETDLWLAETVAFISLKDFDEAKSKLVVIKELIEQVPKQFSFKIENIL